MNPRTTAGGLRIRRRRLHQTEESLDTYSDFLREQLNGLEPGARVQFVKLDPAPQTMRRLYPPWWARLAKMIKEWFKWW